MAGKSSRFQYNQFSFFYTNKSPFSQFYKVAFEVDGVKYSCAEQYMMHQKAGKLLIGTQAVGLGVDLIVILVTGAGSRFFLFFFWLSCRVPFFFWRTGYVVFFKVSTDGELAASGGRLFHTAMTIWLKDFLIITR